MNVFNAIDDRLNADEHAWPAPIGTVIYFVVSKIHRPISQIVHNDFDEPFLDRFGQQALGHVSRKDLRKEGNDVDSQHKKTRARGPVLTSKSVLNEEQITFQRQNSTFGTYIHPGLRSL